MEVERKDENLAVRQQFRAKCRFRDLAGALSAHLSNDFIIKSYLKKIVVWSHRHFSYLTAEVDSFQSK